MRTPRQLKPLRLKPAEWRMIAQAVRDASLWESHQVCTLRTAGSRGLARKAERSANDLSKLWWKLGSDGETAEYVGTRPGRLTRGNSDPRRDLLNRDQVEQLIRRSFDAPPGSWSVDADPEFTAGLFLEYCKSRLIRPDRYSLSAYLTMHLTPAWTVRVETKSENHDGVQGNPQGNVQDVHLSA